MNVQTYIGSKISLISRAGIRYEGILCSIDADNSTVALSKVRSFGTEDRSIDDPIAPRDEIFNYIMFRGSDIQDIHVSEYPNKKMSLISQDSAIIKISPLEGEDKNYANKRPSFGRRSLDNRRRSESIPRYVSNNYAADARPLQDARFLSRMRDRSEEDAQPYYVTRGRRYFNRRSPVVYYRGNSVPKHQGDNLRTTRRRSTTEGRNRLDSESQKSVRTKYASDYDFESENAKIAEELEKLEISKGIQNKRKTHNKSSIASSNRQASGDKASDNLTNDSNSSGAGSDCTDNSDELVNLTSKDPNLAEFYNQKKSFYDNISSEAKDRAKGKTIRSLNWREEKKLNSETFGLVNRSRRAPYYSGYFYRMPGRSDYMRMGLYPGMPNAGRNRGYWRNSGYSYYEHRPMLVGWR